MSLLALQRDFRAWLTTEAAGAAARMGAAAAPGLAVYLNNYRGSLMACLADSFPVVRAWIGDTAFESAAAHHVDRMPPQAWTLDAYAPAFADTLAARYPGDPEVGDLARLECALGLAFVGRDANRFDPADAAHVDWERATFRFVPTFATLAVSSNAAAIWSAIDAGETPPAAVALPEPATIAIWRNGFSPRFRTLASMEAQALSIAVARGSFGQVCALVVDRLGEVDGQAAAGALLGRWLGDGLIESIAG